MITVLLVCALSALAVVLGLVVGDIARRRRAARLTAGETVAFACGLLLASEGQWRSGRLVFAAGTLFFEVAESEAVLALPSDTHPRRVRASTADEPTGLNPRTSRVIDCVGSDEVILIAVKDADLACVRDALVGRRFGAPVRG